MGESEEELKLSFISSFLVEGNVGLRPDFIEEINSVQLEGFE